jgi:hypothetical protein
MGRNVLHIAVIVITGTVLLLNSAVEIHGVVCESVVGLDVTASEA